MGASFSDECVVGTSTSHQFYKIILIFIDLNEYLDLLLLKSSGVAFHRFTKFYFTPTVRGLKCFKKLFAIVR